MVVGIAGLGLIGGSLAKAYERSGATVYGYDGNRVVQDFAKLQGVLASDLDENTIGECELLLVALYPEVTMEYLKKMAPHIPGTTLVMDCCGVKQEVCKVGFELAERYGFTFVGGHPMAGTHFSGFKYSSAELFRGAPMVIVPPDHNDIELLGRVKALLAPAGFKHISVTTAADHDEKIAFTSQLAHVVSNAYIKSPTALMHRGFSAGSYKDMTRVAWLNPKMWAELFMLNRDDLGHELDILIDNLKQYKDALEAGDEEGLIRLLDDGRRLKQEVDG